MSDPLVLPLAAVIAGILLGRIFAFSVSEGAWPALAFLALVLLCHWRGALALKRTCLALALVFAGIFFEAWHRPGPPPEIDAGSRETVLISGCVVEPTVFSEDREQFTLELDPGARARVTMGLSDEATEGGDDGEKLERGEIRARGQHLDYGQRVEIEARLRRPRNFNNPGSFDYAGYLARQHIFWTAFMAPSSEAKILPGRCGSRFMAAIFALRGAALERIERMYPHDEYATGMMEAILLGETSKLEKVWTVNFRRTGTFHALVISGVHVAVLAGVLLFLLRLCAIPELPALGATALAAWLYALVSGFSPPVVRAAAGFTLYLIARFFFRRGRVMNLLAAVALIYVAWDPGALFDASFQLSFLSVAAIGALIVPLLEPAIGPLSRGLRSIANPDVDAHLDPRAAQLRVEVRLAAETIHLWTAVPLRWALEAIALLMRFLFFAMEMAAISAVMQIGLALPMAEYFHRISFTGVSANLMIVPMMEALVPIGFFAIFTGWHWVAALAGLLLKMSARVADWHAGIEPSWRVPDPPAWLALGFVAALIAFGTVVARRAGVPQSRWRWPAGAAVAMLFGLLLWQPWPSRAQPGTLEMTAIDVGQGDSLLVVFPNGQNMVVDGGGLLQFGRRRRSNLDIGEDVVSPYLWSRGIRRIDVLVATHAHADHSGGISALLDNFKPHELWTGAYPAAPVVDHAKQVHVPVRSLRASAPFDFGGARIEILSPPPDYSAKQPGNNDSLAFRITYGTRSFLLTGDMERPREERLLSDDRMVHADVLKVGHHGSKTSTTQPFLDAVSPLIAVISAGYENSFGHPHRDVTTRLAERRSAVLRTDLDGLVTVRSDGRRLWMDTTVWEGGSAWWTGEHAATGFFFGEWGTGQDR